MEGSKSVIALAALLTFLYRITDRVPPAAATPFQLKIIPWPAAVAAARTAAVSETSPYL